MRGDEEFDAFVTSVWGRLRWSAYLLTGDAHLAEDLAQGALARTYAAWPRVRRADALAYTRRVLVNLNTDRLRRRRFLEVGDGALASTADVDRTSGPEDRDEIVRLLAGLTERERRVVVLRHYFDLSVADVSHELGIAQGTVKSTLARALGKLRVAASPMEHERTVGR